MDYDGLPPRVILIRWVGSTAPHAASSRHGAWYNGARFHTRLAITMCTCQGGCAMHVYLHGCCAGTTPDNTWLNALRVQACRECWERGEAHVLHTARPHSTADRPRACTRKSGAIRNCAPTRGVCLRLLQACGAWAQVCVQLYHAGCTRNQNAWGPAVLHVQQRVPVMRFWGPGDQN